MSAPSCLLRICMVSSASSQPSSFTNPKQPFQPFPLLLPPRRRRRSRPHPIILLGPILPVIFLLIPILTRWILHIHALRHPLLMLLRLHLLIHPPRLARIVRRASSGLFLERRVGRAVLSVMYGLVEGLWEMSVGSSGP